MSRADARSARGPRIGASVRAAGVDFYYHSIRLVTANLVWGAGFLALLGLATVGDSPVAALVAAPLLAVPWVGVVRLATLIVRDEDVVLSDAFVAYRAYAVPAVLAGAALTTAAAVFLTNVAIGLQLGGVVGWSFATLAGWGAVTTWLVALAFWPLLVDPGREAEPVMDKVRLAGLLVIAFPGRLAVLAVVVAIALAVSTVAIAAIATVSVAYVALVASRYVLPAADRLAAGRRRPVPGDAASTGAIAQPAGGDLD